MKGVVEAISIDPEIMTSECAAYGSPHPLLPDRNLEGDHDYEVIAEENMAYMQVAQFSGPGDFASEEGAYELV